MFLFGIKQPSPWTADEIRGECLLQFLGLQEDRETGECTFGKRCGRKRCQGRPEMLFGGRINHHAFAGQHRRQPFGGRSEEHTSELQSLMRISYAVFCLKKKK